MAITAAHNNVMLSTIEGLEQLQNIEIEIK